MYRVYSKDVTVIQQLAIIKLFKYRYRHINFFYICIISSIDYANISIITCTTQVKFCGEG